MVNSATNPRKSHRLPRTYYLGQRSYFVTICTKNRTKIFTRDPTALPAISILQHTCAHNNFMLYAYCFMPDHSHLILNGTHRTSDLIALIHLYKGASSTALTLLGIPNPWQKGYYDHVLRTADDRSAATAYLLENPIRAGLSADVTSYPYSGSQVLNLHSFHSH